MNKQAVIIQHNNGETIVYRFKSDVELDFADIYNWITANADFDEDKDTATIINDVIDVEYRKNK